MSGLPRNFFLNLNFFFLIESIHLKLQVSDGSPQREDQATRDLCSLWPCHLGLSRSFQVTLPLSVTTAPPAAPVHPVGMWAPDPGLRALNSSALIPAHLLCPGFVCSLHPLLPQHIPFRLMELTFHGRARSAHSPSP